MAEHLENPPGTPKSSGDETPDEILWDRAWVLLDQTLCDQKREKYDVRKVETDNKRIFQEMKDFQESAKEKSLSRPIKIRGRSFDVNFSTIVARLEVVMAVGDAAVKYTPEIVGVIWGVLRFGFDLSKKQEERLCIIIDAIDRMVEAMFIGRLYGELYFSTSDSNSAAQKVVDMIPELYVIILEFYYNARYQMMRKNISQWLHSTLGTWSSQIEDLATRADESINRLHQTANIPFQKVALDFFNRMGQFSETVDSIDDLMANEVIPGVKGLSLDLSKIGYELKKQQQRQQAIQDHESECSWLADSGNPLPVSHAFDQMGEHLKKRVSGTCHWIRQNKNYRIWVGEEVSGNNIHDQKRTGEEILDENVSDEKTSMQARILWILAEAGFGKSVTVSYLLWKLKDTTAWMPEQTDLPPNEEQLKQKNQPYLISFFCKKGDPQRDQIEKIILHLLRQIFEEFSPELWPKDDHTSVDDAIEATRRCAGILKSIHPKQRNYGRADSIGHSVLRNALIEVLGLFKRPVIFIIDAVDECDDWGHLIRFMSVLVERRRNTRLLFSSRLEISKGVRQALKDMPMLDIRIDSKANTPDIKTCARTGVARLPNIDKRTRAKVVEDIVQKSNGLFRFATVIIQSLLRPEAIADTRKAVSDLPDSMHQFYRRLAESLDPQHQKWLVITLRWIICGNGSVDISVIADELHNVYTYEVQKEQEDPEEEDENNTDAPDDEKEDISDEDQSHEGHQKSAFWEDSRSTALGIALPHPEIPISVDLLLTAAQYFLKLGSPTTIELRHKSVQDWIEKDTKALDESAKLCPRCRMELLITPPFPAHEAAPKYGHLLVAANIMRKLNNTEFQSRYIIGESAWPLRYELRQWSYHIRQFEKSWIPDSQRAHAKPKKSQRPWKYSDIRHSMPPEYAKKFDELQDDLVEFIDADSKVFQSWQRHIWPRRDDFFSPLHVSARLGLQGMIEKFLETGDISSRTENGETPLYLACLEGDFAGISFLLREMEKRGSRDINMQESKSNQTPLICAVAFKAGKANIENLLDHGADPKIPDSEGYTCLHYAAAQFNYEVCKLLIDSGKVDVNAQDVDGETPLHWILKKREAPLKIVALLVEQGKANVNAKDRAGEAPLHEACRARNFHCVQLLLNHQAQVSAVDNRGWTAINRAIWNRDEGIVTLLLDHGAEIVSHGEQARTKPIKQAAMQQSLSILELLLTKLEEQGQNLHVLLDQDEEGDTLLHCCVRMEKTRSIEVLLKRSAEVPICAQANSQGMTPLQLALSLWLFGTVDEEVLLTFAKHYPKSPEILAFFDAAKELGSEKIILSLSSFSITAMGDDHSHLPSVWNSDDKSHEILVSDDGVEVWGEAARAARRASIRTNNPVPSTNSHYYFEVEILECGSIYPTNVLGIGFCSKYWPLAQMPGWPNYGRGFDCYGYHSDDGRKFHNSGRGSKYGPLYGKNDVVGAAVDFETQEIFFTKNGEHLGVAFSQVKFTGRLYPVVGMCPKGIRVRANFGNDPFVFDWKRSSRA